MLKLHKQIKKNIQLKKKVLIEKIKSPKNGFTYSYNYTNLIDKSLIDLINYIDPKDKEYCLIAVGGYGRSDVAPFSDIDLLFIYSKKNKNIKIFISKLNNALWDIGLEIKYIKSF